jgi:hypothetical protein
MKHNRLDELIVKGYEIDIEKSFKEGWEIFKAKPLFSMGYAAFVLLLQVTFALYLPDISFVFTIFLAGPLYAGFFLVANKISINEEVIYPDFLTGFRYYMPVVTVWLVGQILAGFGILFLVVPGIYLMVGYMFAVLMAIFGGFDFWNALEYSRKVIHVRWWKFFYLMLLLVVMNIIGALLLIVGLMVTLPLTFYIIYCLFEKITQEAFVDEQ